MSSSDEPRPAEPGELCTCGRQAVTVIPTDRFGDVGYCGIEGAASRPVLPCPWCGAHRPHETSYGSPDRCPNYTLRPPVGQETSSDGGNAGADPM